MSTRTAPPMLYGCCVFIQSKCRGKNDEENFQRVGIFEIFN